MDCEELVLRPKNGRGPTVTIIGGQAALDRFVEQVRAANAPFARQWASFAASLAPLARESAKHYARLAEAFDGEDLLDVLEREGLIGGPAGKLTSGDVLEQVDHGFRGLEAVQEAVRVRAQRIETVQGSARASRRQAVVPPPRGMSRGTSRAPRSRSVRASVVARGSPARSDDDPEPSDDLVVVPVAVSPRRHWLAGRQGVSA